MEKESGNFKSSEQENYSVFKHIKVTDVAGVVGGKRRRDDSVIQVRGERLSIYDMEFGF